MRAIFISYRRNDSEGEAGRLLDDLVEHFGEDSVFMDVTAIEAGRDFRKAIDESVATCGVLLAVIGTNWVDAKTDAGLRRLDDPADFVRLETASALRRDIPVIPVLVRGARMPRPEQLPDDLKDLAYRNGVELTHARWGSDLQLLIKALRAHVGDLRAKDPGPIQTAVTQKSPRPGPEELLTAETSRSGSHAADGASLADRPSEKSGGPQPSSGPPVVRRRETKWLAVGAGLLVALALGGYGAYYFKGERERQALELQRRTAEDDAARRRVEAERAELAQKQADLERSAAKLAADRAAEKAEADRRRDAEEAAARRAAAEKAEANRRRDAEEAAARRAAAEKAAADQAAAERRPSSGPATLSPTAPFSVKVASAACTDLGSGKYRVETSGVAGGGVESRLYAGPLLPPRTTNDEKTICSSWSGRVRAPNGIVTERACERGANEASRTTWRSRHVFEWHTSEPPSVAVAMLYSGGTLKAEDRLTFRCK